MFVVSVSLPESQVAVQLGTHGALAGEMWREETPRKAEGS